LIRYIKGEGQTLLKEISKDMKKASKEQRYEEAAVLRNQYRHLAELQNQIIFGDREFLDISKDQALSELARMLALRDIPYRIEGYDISHMSGTNNVASMVVATNGLADRKEYRKFKLRLPGNDDFAHMYETLCRRFSGRHENWQTPDLILIDGGKGQLTAASKALNEKNLQIPVIGFAKREEEIVVHKTQSHVNLNAESHMVLETDDFYMVRLSKNSHVVKLLQRIRDESHRFAISYHSTLKIKNQTVSVLDTIPGIGPATRKKIIRAFGSIKGVKQTSEEDIAKIIGLKKAKQIKQAL
jgi:excinuclease ABC subunit C